MFNHTHTHTHTPCSHLFICLLQISTSKYVSLHKIVRISQLRDNEEVFKLPKHQAILSLYRQSTNSFI
jgi:hypothetical protein